MKWQLTLWIYVISKFQIEYNINVTLVVIRISCFIYHSTFSIKALRSHSSAFIFYVSAFQLKYRFVAHYLQKWFDNNSHLYNIELLMYVLIIQFTLCYPKENDRHSVSFALIGEKRGVHPLFVSFRKNYDIPPRDRSNFLWTVL